MNLNKPSPFKTRMMELISENTDTHKAKLFRMLRINKIMILPDNQGNFTYSPNFEK